MAEYRVSKQAEFDLLNIYEATEKKFGQYQADAYHSGLERSFGLLADYILIRALIHVKMNLRDGTNTSGLILYDLGLKTGLAYKAA